MLKFIQNVGKQGISCQIYAINRAVSKWGISCQISAVNWVVSKQGCQLFQLSNCKLPTSVSTCRAAPDSLDRLETVPLLTVRLVLSEKPNHILFAIRLYQLLALVLVHYEPNIMGPVWWPRPPRGPRWRTPQGRCRTAFPSPSARQPLKDHSLSPFQPFSSSWAFQLQPESVDTFFDILLDIFDKVV